MLLALATARRAVVRGLPFSRSVSICTVIIGWRVQGGGALSILRGKTYLVGVDFAERHGECMVN